MEQVSQEMDGFDRWDSIERRVKQNAQRRLRKKRREVKQQVN